MPFVPLINMIGDLQRDALDNHEQSCPCSLYDTSISCGILCLFKSGALQTPEHYGVLVTWCQLKTSDHIYCLLFILLFCFLKQQGRSSQADVHCTSYY